jgi:hypothetical protein
MTVSLGARSRGELLRGPAIVGASGLAAAALIHLRDPHDEGSYGTCPFLAVTGRPCPGCGGLRAVSDLTHGDILGAASSNLLAIAVVAVLAMAWLVWAVRRWRGDDRPMLRVSERSGLAIVAVFVVFGIARNTPWGAGFAP